MLVCVVIRADSSLVRNLQAAVCSWACKERDHVVFAPFGPTVTPCSQPLARLPSTGALALGTLMLPREGCERQQADISALLSPPLTGSRQNHGDLVCWGHPKSLQWLLLLLAQRLEQSTLRC